jgi:hypothetical protein
MKDHIARVASLVGTVLSLSLPSGFSHAYVREVTSEGVQEAWHSPCITMQIYLGSPPSVLTAADYFTASTRAAAVWSYPSLACTDIRLSVEAEAQSSADVGYDHKNVIVFRQESWCRQPAPVNDAGVSEPDCYSPSALALTSVFKNSKTGEILDADIEFNAVYFTWGDRVAKPDLATSTTMDFEYALTHELGHVIGLDHPCYDGTAARLNDNTGAPEVDCNNSTLPSSVAQAIMYPSVDLTSVKTKQRDLSADDQQGDCDIYPHTHDVCPTSSAPSGCSVDPTTNPGSGNAPPLENSLTIGILAIGLAILGARWKH